MDSDAKECRLPVDHCQEIFFTYDEDLPSVGLCINPEFIRGLYVDIKHGGLSADVLSQALGRMCVIPNFDCISSMAYINDHCVYRLCQRSLCAQSLQ